MWNAPDTCSGITFFAPSCLAWSAAASTPDGEPGDDDLSRGVEVGHPHVGVGTATCDLDLVVVEPEDCGHGAGLLEAGIVHGGAALDHEADSVVEAERARRGECGVLAEAVAGAETGLDAESLDGVEHHQARHERRQLGVAGVLEFVGVGVAEQGADVAAGDLGGLVDEFPTLVVTPRQPHAGALGPLSREGEGEHRGQARPPPRAERATDR